MVRQLLERSFREVVDIEPKPLPDLRRQRRFQRLADLLDDHLADPLHFSAPQFSEDGGSNLLLTMPADDVCLTQARDQAGENGVPNHRVHLAGRPLQIPDVNTNEQERITRAFRTFPLENQDPPERVLGQDGTWIRRHAGPGPFPVELGHSIGRHVRNLPD